jgi:hypothetical protein
MIFMKKKDKKTSEASGVKKKLIAGDMSQDSTNVLSIIDQAKAERNTPPGRKRIKQREVFKLWLSLPDQFKGAPERITALLGMTDPIALELLKIPTMIAFGAEFGIHPPTLSDWRREIEDHSDFLSDVKKEMRKTTRNILGALYRKTLEEGDAARVTAWMKIVEDWREQLGVQHSGEISTLSDEKKAALDRLLEKNRE